MTRLASVVVGGLTNSIDGVFGYTVTVARETETGRKVTELDRFTGNVLDWQALKAKANERAAFFAEAFGVTLF